MLRGVWGGLALAGLLVSGWGARAQETYDIRAHYRKSEHMIPMRDGVKLYAAVYAPRDGSGRYPFLVHRTPYGSGPYGPDAFRNSLGPSQAFAREGYIFVYEDVRGQFRSEGEFVVMRPILPDKKSPRDTDESTDLYDTIEWLLKNVPNHNGRVGQWGISYPGSQTVWGMIDAHPALRASSPQAPAIDMFIGDDFHHNGAFRLMYTFSWLSGSARTRKGPSEARDAPFDYGTPDGYRFFLRAGSVARIDEKYFQGAVPTWTEYMQHPDYDEYWQRQNPVRYLKNIRHAVLTVAGWFDAEDFYGPLETYRNIEKYNPSNTSTIVIGPWLHGGWASMPGDSLGEVRFGSKTGEYYREKVELPFFNLYLKDREDTRLPEALVFETGANQWRSFDAWPPRQAEPREIYFHPGGRLAFGPPPGGPADAAESFTSDPARPVPFSAETRTTQGHLWMVEDQRFASTRPDVLVYESEVLGDDLTIAGPIVASLWVSTTGTDADWICKLIDVYPGNAPDNAPNPRGIRAGDFQMLLAGEVFRSKYRNGYSKPEPLVPGQATRIEFSLRDRFHRFLKRHRVMVQVQSSWFPVIDRNPQKFLDIYRAAESDFQVATHRVYRSEKYPSGVKLLVLK
ncbi:MAG: X-Pro dipeptidyl-peptidase [Acidobacteria bacterium]|nr:MAG: X-Pro dipeptidyl-peptidase [Acidobacteriota bacterium]